MNGIFHFYHALNTYVMVLGLMDKSSASACTSQLPSDMV